MAIVSSNFKKSILLIMFIMLMYACGNKTATTNDSYINEINAMISEGDVVFRRGEGIVSQVVLAHDLDGNYSHIGLVVRDDGKLKIAHSVPGEYENPEDIDRVKIDDIETFFSNNHASKGAIKRFALNEEQKGILSNKAIDKFVNKVLFDHHYNLEDTSELYCTEFVNHVFMSIGIDLSEGRRTSAYIPGMQGDYIMPSDIYNNEELKLIYCF